MWQLTHISAKNICAFRELEFSPLQGCTTLIFGCNRDNDSQGSNGSGKSALIEAIAMALTGDFLRKVGTEEMINDSQEDAKISCTLTNLVTGDVFIINRSISRVSPQTISVVLNGTTITQPSILEYNRFILDTIGVTKDDIFSSYILSKHKYTSFLNASDRVKKELINRFSNGNLVDVSIDHLRTDIKAAENTLHEAEKDVARFEGRVSTINEQIETAQLRHEAKIQRSIELISAHEEAIARLRGVSRSARESIDVCTRDLDVLCATNDSVENVEETQSGVEECYNKLTGILENQDLVGKSLRNYTSWLHQLNGDIEQLEVEIEEFKGESEDIEAELNDAAAHSVDIAERLDVLNARNTSKRKSLELEMKQLSVNIDALTSDNQMIAQEIGRLNRDSAQIKALISGAIECPNCHHRFALESDKSVEELNSELEVITKKLKRKLKEETANNNAILGKQDEIQDKRNELKNMNEEELAIKLELTQTNQAVSSFRNQLADLKAELEDKRIAFEGVHKRLAHLREKMFDEVYDMIDKAVSERKSSIMQHETTISTNEGAIANYIDAIAELKKTSASLDTEELEERKTAYEEDLKRANTEAEKATERLNELIEQEMRFMDFKTHLANSKIEALGQLTNEFLEAFGSDIRISFSGYKKLKSGKMRDKIDISLSRDGIDCGSFAKFSAGEQCRANLASVLALHKLTNANCSDEKGLNLLILDEILDATDESGLANMFEALNNLKITSMVVSHGQVAEAYPYKLTVTKMNGISTINDKDA